MQGLKRFSSKLYFQFILERFVLLGWFLKRFFKKIFEVWVFGVLSLVWKCY